MKVLLINITRFGDLLQTQASIHDLVRSGHTVSVVCLEDFALAAALLSGVEHVFALPSAALLAFVQPNKCTKSLDEYQTSPAALAWVSGLALLDRWRESVVSIFSPDTVINLTPTLAARVLSRYLSPVHLGFGLDENGFSYSSNLWAALLFGATKARGVSPFNIVDVLRHVAALEPFINGNSPGQNQIQTPSLKHLAACTAQLERAAPEGCRGFISFQLGASEERRCWPVASFARLGALLWETDRLCPVLLGSKEEVVLADEYAARSIAPHISLCGKTSLHALATVLCCTRMLVTNDTGTMHLAATLNIPILGLFFASAQPFDTGPYMAGCCAVEPCLACHPCAHGSECSQPDNNCRGRVTVETIYTLCHHFLVTGEWMKHPYSQDAKERIWLSSFDANGFMKYLSLSGHDIEDRSVWLTFQRFFLFQFLAAMSSKNEFIKFTVVPYLGVLSAASKECLYAELKDMAALFLLLEGQGTVLQQKPVPHMHVKFIATWKHIHHYCSQSRWLGALTIIWVEQSQGKEGDISEIIHASRSYANLIHAITRVLDTSG